MRRYLLAAAVLALGASLLPTTANAHGELIGSSPAPNSNLPVAPTELRLIFSERPERAFTRISLTGPTGAAIALGETTFGPGNVASARIAGSLVAGLYRVAWQTLGRDGHPVNGSFTFAIAPDAVGISAGSDTAIGASARGVEAPVPALRNPDLAPVATLLRWLTLAGVIAVVGTVAFRVIVVRRLAADMPADVAEAYVRPLESGSASIGLWSSGVLIFVAVARLAVQVTALDTLSGDGTSLSALLGSTYWGRAWLLHVAGAGAAVIAFSAVLRGTSWGWKVAAAGGAGATIGLALSGHAVAVPLFPALTVAGHVVHALAAASWLGTLLMVVLVALPLSFRLDRRDRWRVVADIIHVFSPAALTFAGVTVVAGILIALSHLRSLDALWVTEYGRVLLLKLALVALTAVAGAYNWRRVRPTLGEQPGARRLRRSATIELAFAALVLAVTAVLVATPMPAE